MSLGQILKQAREEKKKKELEEETKGLSLGQILKKAREAKLKKESEEEKTSAPNALGARLFGNLGKKGDGNEGEGGSALVRALQQKFEKSMGIQDQNIRSKAQEGIIKLGKIEDFKLKRKIQEKAKEERTKQAYQNEDQIYSLMKTAVQSTVSNKTNYIEQEHATKDVGFLFEIHKKMREQSIRKQIFEGMFNYFKDMLIDRRKLQETIQKGQKTVQDEHLKLRAETKKIYKICYLICSHSLFPKFISLSIILNTVVLSLDKYPINEDQQRVLESLNLVFFSIFFAEMILKLGGMGFKYYFKDKFNTFDCFIVLVSSVEVSMYIVDLDVFSGGSAIQALRTFRLLRVFKLAKSWRQFQNLLKTISHTLKDISTFSILLFLFIFTYTILGMELFAYKAKFNDNNEVDMSENGTWINQNFNTFLQAFLSVFVLLTGDRWTTNYFQHYYAAGKIVSSIFFISILLIGRYILLMLFLAILVQNFDNDSINQELEMKAEQLNQKKQSFFKGLFTKVKELFSQQETQESEQTQQTLETQQDKSKNKNLKSLFIFSEENELRVFITKVIKSNKFDILILILIILSSITLILGSPLTDLNSTKLYVIDKIDVGLTCLFIIEFILKVIAYGFVLNGPESYLRNSWNVLDFIIVICSGISLSFQDVNLSFFKILRMLRILRPLRVIAKNEGLKVLFFFNYLDINSSPDHGYSFNNKCNSNCVPLLYYLCHNGCKLSQRPALLL